MIRRFNLSIIQKINTIPVLGFLGFTLVLLFLFIANQHQVGHIKWLERQSLPTLEALNNATIKFHQIKQLHLQAIIEKNAKLIEDSEVSKSELISTIDTLSSSHTALSSVGNEARQALSDFFSHSRTYSLFGINEGVNTSSAIIVKKKLAGYETAFLDIFTVMSNKVKQEINRNINQRKASNQRLFYIGTALIISMTIALFIIANYIAYETSYTIGQVIQTANTLSTGKLDIDITYEGGKESVDLLRALNVMRKQLLSALKRSDFEANSSRALQGRNHQQCYHNLFSVLEEHCNISRWELFVESGENGLASLYQHNYKDDGKVNRNEVVDSEDSEPTHENTIPSAIQKTSKAALKLKNQDLPKLIEDIKANEQISASAVHTIGWPIVYQDTCIAVLCAYYPEALPSHTHESLDYVCSQLALHIHGHMLDNDRASLIKEVLIEKSKLETELSAADKQPKPDEHGT